MRRFVSLALLLACVSLAACGYRLAGQRLNTLSNGRGRTIAIPTFTTRSTTYRIQQRLSEAVRLELTRRTRYQVVSDNTGDVLVSGDVLSVSATPILLNEQGRASSFGLLVDVSIRVTDNQTGAVLFPRSESCRPSNGSEIAGGFRELLSADRAFKNSTPNAEAYLDVMLWKLIG